jgi:hypothetical protein
MTSTVPTASSDSAATAPAERAARERRLRDDEVGSSTAVGGPSSTVVGIGGPDAADVEGGAAAR